MDVFLVMRRPNGWDEASDVVGVFAFEADAATARSDAVATAIDSGEVVYPRTDLEQAGEDEVRFSSGHWTVDYTVVPHAVTLGPVVSGDASRRDLIADALSALQDVLTDHIQADEPSEQYGDLATMEQRRELAAALEMELRGVPA